MTDTKPVKLVTQSEETRRHCLDVLDELTKAIVDREIEPNAVLVVVSHARGTGERTRMRMFGRGHHLLGMAVRAQHEINQEIDRLDE